MPDLRERIDALFDEEPEHRPVDVHLSSGRRALRRRRWATSVGALAAVAVVGVATYVVQGSPGADAPGDDNRMARQEQSAPPEADPEAELLKQCHDTEKPGSAAAFLWGAGQPEVMASIESWEGHTRAYLRSADQRFWTNCFVEDGVGYLMPAQRIAPNPTLEGLGYSYGMGPACSHARDDCRRFVATTEGRRDPAVARIEVRFLDGQWEKVDTNEGYYFLEHVGTLPEDITWSADGSPLRNGEQIDDVINRVRLLDAEGRLLAYFDSSQNANGPNAPNDKGVAELEAYPEIQSKLAGPAGDRDVP